MGDGTGTVWVRGTTQSGDIITYGIPMDEPLMVYVTDVGTMRFTSLEIIKVDYV